MKPKKTLPTPPPSISPDSFLESQPAPHAPGWFPHIKVIGDIVIPQSVVELIAQEFLACYTREP